MKDWRTQDVLTEKTVRSWRTQDILTEKVIRLKRNGYSLVVHNLVYDEGRRQQFKFSRTGSDSRFNLFGATCDHHLGVYGHMQRLLNQMPKVLTPEYIAPELLNEVVQSAGRLVGVGDFRPTFGRFQVV